jgi:hypothetical protein
MTTLIPKYDQGATGAVNRPFDQKLAEIVSVKDFGTVGNGTINDTAAIQAAITAIGVNQQTLSFPQGTYLCSNLTFPANITLLFNGGILKVAAGQTVDIRGTINCPNTVQCFSFVDSPTGLNSVQPIKLSADSNLQQLRAPQEISICWFGAVGNYLEGVTSTDNTLAIQCAFSAVSSGGLNGAFSSSYGGSCVVKVPRGRYLLTGTVYMSSGTVLSGEYGGSSAVSEFVRKDNNTNHMIVLYGGGLTGTSAGNSSQHFIKFMGFQFYATADYATNTAQQDTGTISFQDPVGNIDTLFDNCWLLGSPNRGAHFLWGNKTIGASPTTGLSANFRLRNTVLDVSNGSHFKVIGAGSGVVNSTDCVLFRSNRGIAEITSTASNVGNTKAIQVRLFNCDITSQSLDFELDGGQTGIVPNNLEIYIDGGTASDGTDGTSDFGFGFSGVNGNVTLLNLKLTKIYTRLIQSTGTNGNLVIKGGQIDYSQVPAFSAPNSLINCYNGNQVLIQSVNIARSSNTKFLNMITGLGATAQLVMTNCATNLASGDIDLAQTSTQQVIQNNIYSTTANTVTLP